MGEGSAADEGHEAGAPGAVAADVAEPLVEVCVDVGGGAVADLHGHVGERHLLEVPLVAAVHATVATDDHTVGNADSAEVLSSDRRVETGDRGRVVDHRAE